MKQALKTNQDIVTEFLTQKRSSIADESVLGKIAVTNSGYFDLGSMNIKSIDYDKSINSSKLDSGYKQAIAVVLPDLSRKQQILEKIIHSKTISRFSNLINQKLLSSTGLITALSLIFLAILSFFIFCLFNHTYPNLYQIALIYPLGLIFGCVVEFIVKIKTRHK